MPGKRHDKKEIQKILSEMEKGLRINAASDKYGVTVQTLYRWKREYSKGKIADSKIKSVSRHAVQDQKDVQKSSQIEAILGKKQISAKGLKAENDRLRSLVVDLLLQLRIAA